MAKTHEGIRPTRYEALGYRCDGRALWRVYDCTDDTPHAVGPHYASKAELLGDLARFAAQFGVTSPCIACGNPSPCPKSERSRDGDACPYCGRRLAGEALTDCGTCGATTPTSMRHECA